MLSNRELELQMSKMQAARTSSPGSSGISHIRRELDEVKEERVQVGIPSHFIEF